ncbi:hypothetical protein [Aquirhabdus parva]|uniref:Uncharacterized protein n=1 Tax=Aquirhabdus parva TaxID=2283318 RepID=A0A345P6N8_9GAMM|nr:hypothetical protein [Aquirhabdus parva]AXI02947.1 hypothetical protein HYN46_08915 [Aquirhabdus parva]
MSLRFIIIFIIATLLSAGTLFVAIIAIDDYMRWYDSLAPNRAHIFTMVFVLCVLIGIYLYCRKKKPQDKEI